MNEKNQGDNIFIEHIPSWLEDIGSATVEGVQLWRMHESMTGQEVRTEYLKVKALCVRLLRQIQRMEAKEAKDE